MLRKMLSVVLVSCVFIIISVVVFAPEQADYDFMPLESALIFEFGDMMSDPFIAPFYHHDYEISILECGNESGMVSNDATIMLQAPTIKLSRNGVSIGQYDIDNIIDFAHKSLASDSPMFICGDVIDALKKAGLYEDFSERFDALIQNYVVDTPPIH